MNGNTPYSGRPGVEPAGRTAVDVDVSLSPEQKRSVKRDLARVADRTRRHLPDDYVVGSELDVGLGGPQATVAVQPPLGYPISAAIELDLDATGDKFVTEEECADLASDLAAQAVFQVMQAVSDSVTPTAQ